MRKVGGLLRCLCGLVLRARDLRDWAASKGKLVQSANNSGVYVVYQEQNSDGQGHVYAVINGSVCGNDLADNWDYYGTEKVYKLK